MRLNTQIAPVLVPVLVLACAMPVAGELLRESRFYR
jgi:hypothetical protein